MRYILYMYMKIFYVRSRLPVSNFSDLSTLMLSNLLLQDKEKLLPFLSTGGAPSFTQLGAQLHERHMVRRCYESEWSSILVPSLLCRQDLWVVAPETGPERLRFARRREAWSPTGRSDRSVFPSGPGQRFLCGLQDPGNRLWWPDSGDIQTAGESACTQSQFWNWKYERSSKDEPEKNIKLSTFKEQFGKVEK